MQPIYRIAEIVVYSLLNFLPFLALSLYPFRNRLRFSQTVTGLLVAFLSFIQIGLGIWAAFFSGGKANVISAVSTVLYAAFYFLAVKMPLGKTIFTLLMISNNANLIVIASKCIEGMIFPSLAEQSYRWSFSLIMFCVEAIIWIPLFIYIKRVYTPAMENEPSGVEWRYLWLIPATFYLIWYCEIYSNSTQSSLEIALQPKYAIFLFFINVGAFLVYFIVVKLISEQNKNMTLQAKNHRLAMQNLQYENLQEKITEARRAKHDVRHHISVMQEYLKQHDVAGLEEYLNQYQMSLPDDSILSFCENTAVNTVLLYFAQQAKNKSIDYIADVAIPNETAITQTDLSVLFGNLLENALDACAAEKTDDKKIVIRATTDDYSLCLAIDNTFTGELKKDKSGVYVSTKHKGSGLGIESVKNIVEKYHGICKFESDGNMFYASIMLNK